MEKSVDMVWDMLEVAPGCVLCLVGADLRSLKRGAAVDVELEVLASRPDNWGLCFGRPDASSILLPHYPRGYVSPASVPPEARRKVGRVAFFLAFVFHTNRFQLAATIARAMMFERAGAFISTLAWKHVYLVGEAGWEFELSTLAVQEPGKEWDEKKNLDVYRGMLRELKVDAPEDAKTFADFWNAFADKPVIVVIESSEEVKNSKAEPSEEVKNSKAEPSNSKLLLAPSASEQQQPRQSPAERAQSLGLEGAALSEILQVCGSDVQLARRAVRGAAKGDHQALVEQLLNRWPDETDNAVNAAASAGRQNLVMWLIETRKADPNRAVIGAAFSGFDALVDLLLVKHGALLSWAVDGAARGGKRELVFSLIAKGMVFVIFSLFDFLSFQGSDEDEREELFEGALQSCASAQHVTLTKALLERHQGKIDSALVS
jgi:hypothetical protein